MSTKIDEILKTKKESGLEQFERLRTEQEKRSARAARTAILSRRSVDAPPDETKRVVRVTAVVRPGHDGFYRAGQFWPSGEGGRVAVVTGRLLAALKSEPNLRVEVDPDDVEGSVDDQDVLDVPVRESIDLSQVLLSQPASAPGGGEDSMRAAYELGRAHALLDKKDAEIARLRAELEASKGGSSAPAAAPPPPPVAPAAGDDDGKKGKPSK